MADVMKCFYCDGEHVDHRHGAGHACGDCCAMHGAFSDDDVAYKWIQDCLTAKNKRIALAEQHAEAAEEQVKRLMAPVSEEEQTAFHEYLNSNLRANDYECVEDTCARVEREALNALLAERGKGKL